MQNGTLKRWQKNVIGLWVGSPIALALCLNLINPGYMYPFFTPVIQPPGLPFVLGIAALNFVILYIGFRALNKRSTNAMSRRQTSAWAFTALTFTIFTLPSLWWVVLQPSLISLLSGGSIGR